MWDALVATQVVDGNVEISLGWSILLYAALGAIMSGFRPLFQRGHGWEIHCLLSGPLLCIFVFSEYLMITFRRGSFLFPKIIWWRIGGEGLAAMIVSPLLFLVLHWLALSFGLIPPREEAGSRAGLIPMPSGYSSMRRRRRRGVRAWSCAFTWSGF